MRTVFSCIALMTFLAVQTTTANILIDVPKNVMTTFQNLYPNATDINWDKFENDYIAYFENDGNYSEATFDSTGKWLETSTSMEVEQMPDFIALYISENIEEAVDYYNNITMTERPDEVRYDVSFATESYTVYLVFNEEGDLLSKEIEE